MRSYLDSTSLRSRRIDCSALNGLRSQAVGIPGVISVHRPEGQLGYREISGTLERANVAPGSEVVGSAASDLSAAPVFRCVKVTS
jgi:hypothetical protein